MYRHLACLAGLALVFAACDSKPKTATSDPATPVTPPADESSWNATAVPKPAAEQPTTELTEDMPQADLPKLTPGEIKWKKARLDGIGLRFDLFDGVRLSDRAVGEAHATSQKTDPVTVAVWQNGASMEEWVRKYGAVEGAKLGPMQKLEVCGVPAQKTWVELPPLQIGDKLDPAERAKRGDSLNIRDTRVIVAMAFVVKGIKVFVGWRLPPEQRERFAADEQRFFDSFECG